MTTYTDMQIENMKQILVGQFEYNFNYQDAILQDETHNLEDGIYTYSVVGFEISAFIDLTFCHSSGITPVIIYDQIQPKFDEANKAYDAAIENGCNEDEAYDFERDCLDYYIDFSIQVNLNQNTIESKVSLEYCVSVFKEDIDYDNFEDQCKRATEAL